MSAIIHLEYQLPSMESFDSRSNNQHEFVKVADEIQAAIKASGYADIEMVGIWSLIEDHHYPQHIRTYRKKLERYFQGQMKDVNVQVFFIQGQSTSPLDDLVLEVDDVIHRLVMNYPFSTFVHLSCETGTILNQALLIEALKAFRDRYHSLYIENGRALSVQYEEDEVDESWMNQFHTFIQDYDYEAALELLKDVDLLDTGMMEIAHLVSMQKHRMNFAFDLAYREYQAAKKLQPEASLLQLQTNFIFENLLSEDDKKRAIEQIQELYRHIFIYIDQKDYPSFLTRFYRVREALLRYIDQAGASGGEGVSRIYSSIYQLIDAIEDKYEKNDISGYYGVYFYMKSTNIATTLTARNKSFIGHSRRPIDVKHLWSHYDPGSKSRESAKRRFMLDSQIMLRDLGGHIDENINEMNKEIRRKLTVLHKKGRLVHV